MALWFVPNFSSPGAAQAVTLEQKTQDRTAQLSQFREIEKLLATTVQKIQESHTHASGLLKQLNVSPLLTASTPNEINSTQILERLAQFLIAIDKIENMERLYPEISLLRRKAGEIESQVAEIDVEIRHLRETKARMVALLKKKQENLAATQKARSSLQS